MTGCYNHLSVCLPVLCIPTCTVHFTSTTSLMTEPVAGGETKLMVVPRFVIFGHSDCELDPFSAKHCACSVRLIPPPRRISEAGQANQRVHFHNFAPPENAGKMRSCGRRSCVVLCCNRLVGAPFPGACGVVRVGKGHVALRGQGHVASRAQGHVASRAQGHMAS